MTDIDDTKKTPAPIGSHHQASRMPARGVLQRKIEVTKDELKALEILDLIIPWGSLTIAEEDTLWSYFCKK